MWNNDLKKLFEVSNKNNLTISSAESVTGGKFSSLITEIEGASKILKGSFICYTNEFKYNILNIDKNIEIVSEEMAIELAKSTQKLIKSSISISFTGNSSNNGIENKPKGMSYIAITNDKKIVTFKYISSCLQRKDIIADTAFFGLKMLIKFICQNYN